MDDIFQKNVIHKAARKPFASAGFKRKGALGAAFRRGYKGQRVDNYMSGIYMCNLLNENNISIFNIKKIVFGRVAF